MSRLWKDLKTNWMYWRFRYITRNRLRLRSWWHRRRASFGTQRPGSRRMSPSNASFRPRGTAAQVYGHSSKRAWALLLGMVIALTALSTWANSTYVAPALVYAIGSLVVVATVYAALKGL